MATQPTTKPAGKKKREARTFEGPNANRERFKFMAENRVNNAVHAIYLTAKLTNTALYSFKPAELLAAADALQKAVDSVAEHFMAAVEGRAVKAVGGFRVVD